MAGTSKELSKLNAYPEFQNQAQYQEIINYLNTHILPAHLNARQRHRYQHKFGFHFYTNDNHYGFLYNDHFFFKSLPQFIKYEYDDIYNCLTSKGITYNNISNHPHAHCTI